MQVENLSSSLANVSIHSWPSRSGYYLDHYFSAQRQRWFWWQHCGDGLLGLCSWYPADDSDHEYSAPLCSSRPVSISHVFTGTCSSYKEFVRLGKLNSWIVSCVYLFQISMAGLVWSGLNLLNVPLRNLMLVTLALQIIVIMGQVLALVKRIDIFDDIDNPNAQKVSNSDNVEYCNPPIKTGSYSKKGNCSHNWVIIDK